MMRLDVAKEEIRNQIKLSLVVEHLTGRPLKGGKMCCPFHLEKTPSFFVNDAKGVYFCQGCGAGGDIFSFVMKDRGIGFVESIKFIDLEFHLGLINQKVSAKALISMNKRREEIDRKEKQRIKLEKAYDDACTEYRIANIAIRNLEVFSELWCYYMEKKILSERTIDECMRMMYQN